MRSSGHKRAHLISRRTFLRTLGLTTGAALVGSRLLYAEHPAFEPFTFVQMSDPHVGSSVQAEKTFRRAIASVEALRPPPAFLLITGDLAAKNPDGTFKRNVVEVVPPSKYFKDLEDYFAML